MLDRGRGAAAGRNRASCCWFAATEAEAARWPAVRHAICGVELYTVATAAQVTCCDRGSTAGAAGLMEEAGMSESIR